MSAGAIGISSPSKHVGPLVGIVGDTEEVSIAAEVSAHAVRKAESRTPRAQHNTGRTERAGGDDHQPASFERSLFGLSDRAFSSQVMDQVASSRILGQILTFDLREDLSAAALGNGQVIGV